MSSSDTPIVRCARCGQPSNSAEMVSGFVDAIFQGKIVSPSSKLRDALNDAAEWKQQHENLLAMYQDSQRELAAANAKLARFENANMPEEPIPIGWISTSTFSWLSEDGAIGQAVFQPNRGGAYGGVAIFTGDQFNALRDFAARASVDAELGAVVWRYIDRMKDIAPECGDGAERILNEFVVAVEEVITKEKK